MKNQFHKIYLLTIPATILILATLACGGTSPNEEATISTATSQPQPEVVVQTEPPIDQPVDTQVPTEAPTNTPVPTIAPTDTPEPESAFLGDALEESGYLLSALSIEDPAKPGVLYQPESGKRLIAVDAVVGISSGNPISVNPLYFVLVDNEGFTYSTELMGVDSQLITAFIVPGEKVRSLVAFKIPDGSTPATLKYDLEPFGGNSMEVSLLPPPEGHQPNTEVLSVMPAEPEAKLGDVYEQYGYSITASSVIDPAEPGVLYTPKEGHRLIAVETTIGNVSGDPITVNVLNTYLVDSNGYVYAAEMTGMDDEITLMELNPGEKVKGFVAFTIPETATPATIKYQLDALNYNFLESGLSQ